jgi:hypothetical protein
MHRGTYINLDTWPKAMSIVRRFYRVETEMTFTQIPEVNRYLDKAKAKHGLNEKYKHRPNC